MLLSHQRFLYIELIVTINNTITFFNVNQPAKFIYDNINYVLMYYKNPSIYNSSCTAFSTITNLLQLLFPE